MSTFYSIFFGVLYCLAVAVWLASSFYMSVIVLAWYEYAMDPTGNKLAGMVWVLFGPTIPVSSVFAAGLLYVGRETLEEVAPRLFKLALFSIGLLFPAFAVGFLTAGTLVTVALMGAVLIFHAATVLLCLGAAAYNLKVPWPSSTHTDSD